MRHSATILTLLRRMARSSPDWLHILRFFSLEELWIQVGLRVVYCLLVVVTLVGGGCSSMGARDLAYQTAYSGVGAQVK